MIDRHSHLFCRGSPYSQNIAVYCQGWHKSEVEIVASLERKIRAAITDGFQTFISGMARGVDIWAAEVVLRLRDNGSPIHLIAASPYQGFERAWSQRGKVAMLRFWPVPISSVLFLCSMIVAASNAAMNGWSTTLAV